MNFPPFGGHFPSTIPSIHQFATDSSSGAGARYANHFPNQPPIGVPVVGKYRPENNGVQSAQSQVMMNNKTSYPNSNVHHYPNVPYSQAQSVQQRPTNSPGMQEKRSYHQVKRAPLQLSLSLSFFFFPINAFAFFSSSTMPVARLLCLYHLYLSNIVRNQ